MVIWPMAYSVRNWQRKFDARKIALTSCNVLPPPPSPFPPSPTAAHQVRVQCFSGTHAIACALFGVLRPGNTMLACSGPPYDTLDEVIGTRAPMNVSLLLSVNSLGCNGFRAYTGDDGLVFFLHILIRLSGRSSVPWSPYPLLEACGRLFASAA